MTTSALVVTPGAAAANSYCDLPTADQYHLDRPAHDTVWVDAVYPGKIQAILWATKLLDRLVPWTGQPVNYTQALLWPRFGMYYRNGDYIPSDVIPVDLQHATAEFARQLLAEDLAETGEAARLGLSSVSLGAGVSLTFKGTASARVIPDIVYSLLPGRWLAHSSSVVELLRG